jgi:hypothetical protein
MKAIRKDEIYHHLNEFLRAKGIEMKDGSYPRAVQAGCSLLADAINLSQQGLERARTEIDTNLDWMRQVIHEKTAPKQPSPTAAKPKAARKPKPQAGRRKRASAKR